MINPILQHWGDGIYCFYCPACKELHDFNTKGHRRWVFNGNKEKPTFTPSLRVYGRGRVTKCHLIMNDGMIEYMNDCPHFYAFRKIPMVPIPDDLRIEVEAPE